MNSSVPDDSATGSNPNESRPPPEGADPLASSETESQEIQVEDSPEAPPPSNVDEVQPMRSSGDRAQDTVHPAQQENTTCYIPGCLRAAVGSQMCEDGQIDRVCSEHKKPAVVVTTVTRAEKCQYPDCERTPRYGEQGGPLSFCQGHKRAGMYTCRDGELFIATRDGSAFRGALGAPAAGASVSGASTPAAPTPAPGASGAPPSGASAAADTTNTSRQTPTPAPTQEPTIDLSTLVLPRKVCQEPSCEAQPSFGVPGSGNPQFCSSHKKDGLVSLKNRPCVEPGCNTRPHYGVSRGKAVFCVTHKLPGMVHLLKEAKTIEKEAHAMRRRKSRLNVAAKRRKEVEARAGNVRATTERLAAQQQQDVDEASHEDPTLEEEEGEGDIRETKGKGKGKRPARAKGVTPRAAFPSEAIQTTAGKTTAGAATAKPAPSPSSTPSPRSSSGQKQKKPYAARPEDPAGLAPSDEMRLFQEARDLARATAEASGSGRRARAPSRKVLEASGKLAGGSIQWMTKEKREEHARRTQEIKEQRKAAAAAGLKLGEVIETISGPSAGGAAESGSAGGGSDGGGASSGGASSGATSSGPSPSSPPSSGAASTGAASSIPSSSGATSTSAISSSDTSSGATSTRAISSSPSSNGGSSSVSTSSTPTLSGATSTGAPTSSSPTSNAASSGDATSSIPSSNGATSSVATSTGATSTGATSSGATTSSSHPDSSSGPSSGPSSSGGFSSGATSSGGFSSGEDAPSTRAFGQQLSPVQPTASEATARGGTEQRPLYSSRDTAETPNSGATANEQEKPVAPGANAEAGTTAVAGKRLNAAASDVESDEARASKRSRHANGDAESDGGNDKSGKTACESENCLKTAKYGINGIVRYCKKHQIFGMQKIVDQR